MKSITRCIFKLAKISILLKQTVFYPKVASRPPESRPGLSGRHFRNFLTAIMFIPVRRHRPPPEVPVVLKRTNKLSQMEKHDLVHEFPELRDKIHELKTSNTHFRKVFDEYHETDHAIHRIESGAEVSTDEYLTELRMKRVHMKDELFKMLNL